MIDIFASRSKVVTRAIGIADVLTPVGGLVVGVTGRISLGGDVLSHGNMPSQKCLVAADLAAFDHLTKEDFGRWLHPT